MELSDVCLKVDLGSSAAPLSGLGINNQRYLPSKGCLLLSPANLWNRNINRSELCLCFGQDNIVIVLSSALQGRQTGHSH